MGFDLACILDICGALTKSRSGDVNYVQLGMEIFNIVKPYVVTYLGNVAPPPKVDVDNAFQQADTVEGFKPWDAKPYDKGNVRALLVGINYFGTKAELSGCINDVKQDLATFQQIKFPVKEMNILVDDPKFPGRVAHPTRENIIRYMAWLVKDAQPGDVLFFHYSGHGTQARSARDSEEAYDQCIAPADYEQAGCILDDDIFSILCSRLPAGVRLTAVMDCCHSGSILDLPFSFTATRSLRSSDMGHMKRTRSGNNTSGDVLMISGCADDQTSADVANTAMFGNGLSGAGGAATQCLTYTMLKTSNLTYQDMLICTRDMLKKKGFSQVPQLSSSKPIDLQQPFDLINAFNVDANVAQY